jgi:hypothetical protein
MKIQRNHVRNLARDRYRSSMHEAGHMVVARHFGVSVQAGVWPSFTENPENERLVIGKCWFASGYDALTEVQRQIISVAGAVAERLAFDSNKDLGLDSDDLIDLHERMSPKDCDAAGFPTRHGDLGFCVGDTFFEAVREAVGFLHGPLAGELRRAAREIRQNGYDFRLYLGR